MTILAEIRELAVKLNRSLAVGGVGFLGRVECPEMMTDIIQTNAGFKSAALMADPFGKRFIGVRLAVALILAVFHVSQVAYAVVSRVAIYVINFNGVDTMNKAPNQPMAQKYFAAKRGRICAAVFRYLPAVTDQFPGVAVVPADPGRAFGEVLAGPLAPRQVSGVGVVIEALAQVGLIWQYLGSHRTFSFSRWSEARLALAGAAAFRHFASTEAACHVVY